MDDIIEAAKVAVRSASGCGLTRDGALVFCDHCDCEDVARAAIAAIMPATGERMAVRAEGHAATGYMSDRERSYCREHGDEIGEQLRALASTMAEEVGK